MCVGGGGGTLFIGPQKIENSWSEIIWNRNFLSSEMLKKLGTLHAVHCRHLRSPGNLKSNRSERESATSFSWGGGGGYKTCVENGLFVVCLLFDFTDKHTKLKRTGIELRNFDDLDSKCLIAFNVMFL